jgi:hypothetical protein
LPSLKSAKLELSSTFALFRERRTPDFPGFPRNAARVSENPSGIADVQKVEIAEFSRLFWAIGLRKRAKVELRGPGATFFDRPALRFLTAVHTEQPILILATPWGSYRHQ